MGAKLFTEVVQRAELQTLRTIAIHAKRGATDETKRELELEEKCEYDLAKDRSALRVLYTFLVKQVSPESDGESVVDPFEACITFELIYKFHPELSEDHAKGVEVFAIHNAKFNCWASLRAFLMRTTAELELPLLTLPLLKPSVPNRVDDEED